MDEIDKANERAAQFLAHSLANAARLQVALPSANGHCLNCAETVATDERWCDTDCRDDWQARQQLRKHFN
jgi:hypothetical protein